MRGEKDISCGDALDGMSILRYAHILKNRASGGVEQYLLALNRGLLERNRMTILQMHLVDPQDHAEIETERVGQGTLIWIPIPLVSYDSMMRSIPSRIRMLIRPAVKGRDKTCSHSLSTILDALGNVFAYHGLHFRYKGMLLSEPMAMPIKERRVDLVAFHWLYYDTDTLINIARRSGIPSVFINHFHNALFAESRAKLMLSKAAAIGSVSEVGMPPALRAVCVNLSDAVDVNFFDPEEVSRTQSAGKPILLLPGRIAEGKGHRDLIEALRIMKARGVEVQAWFVGVTESSALLENLRAQSEAYGVGNQIEFLGELSQAELRNCYGMSTASVLPTFSEGLPRVLLEAQAMAKPVVTYDSGGVREALLQDQTGFLLSAGDVAGLADRLEYLVRYPEIASAMGKRGREFVSERFSVASLVTRHEKFYRDTVTRPLSLRGEAICSPSQ